MRKLVLLSISGLFYAVSSCCGCGGNDEAAHGHDSAHTDSTAVILVDTTTFKDTGGYAVDSLQQANDIVALYGEQWEFCDCVVKNDSVNKVLETATDAEIDAVLLRMDVIDQHCKGMLNQPNTTPEQRDRHNRKVRKCLKEAGVL